ncbi:MAG: RNA methyltransferase [Bacteroidales bacterium]|jgi:TrmH family RNA methyltransferase|nr:RNA methyltransferase [Bacteroidales bacterium]
MTAEKITSARNPRIKELILLQSKSRERKERALFVVEGARELSRAIEAGFVPHSIFYCSKYIERVDLPKVVEGTEVFEVSADLYDKIAYRGGTEGVIALIRMEPLVLEKITLSDNPLVIVVESLEKPGNLGAILRSADACGADCVLVCDPLADVFNPNVIRASTGACFSVKCACCTSEEAYQWLSTRNIFIITTQLQDYSLYYDIDLREAVAIVFGREDRGLSDFWKERSNAKIRIPMAGICDSLNVSVSVAVICFEALRQRKRIT